MRAVIKQIDETNYTADILASTPGVDRDKEMILPTAWDVTNFMKNPVLVNSHDYQNVQNVIGRILDVFVDDQGLHAKVQYLVNQGNAAADWAWALAKQGLAAYSVGFIEKESKPGTNGVSKIYTRVELLEISQVVVPANPEAVISALSVYKGLQNKEVKAMEEVKGVIPYKDLGNADENEPWDAAQEIKDATVDDLKLMCAWYDSENPDIKSSYKLPHHHASGHKAVWRAVAAAMAALFGARGGVDIPDADKHGVYNHLAKHYKDFDKEPPEFHKDYTSDEEIYKACGLEIETKTGRVLSEANRQKIKDVTEHIDSLIKELKNLKQPLEELLDISEVQQDSVPIDTMNVLKKLNEAFKDKN